MLYLTPRLLRVPGNRLARVRTAPQLDASGDLAARNHMHGLGTVISLARLLRLHLQPSPASTSIARDPRSVNATARHQD